MNQDLIDLIVDGAVLVRQGAFSLAVEKAQEKLKKFQLPDPSYYITQFMQALLAGGANRIEIFSEGLSVRIVFNGPGYTREELESISDAVFESGKNRERDRIRELALGLLSVQGLSPQAVSVASNGFRWEKGGTRGKLSPSPTPLQEISVVHRRAGTNEIHIVRQTCASCHADIYGNNSLLFALRGARETSCPWPNFAFKGPNFRGAFGIAYGEIPATALTLTRHGVIFSRRKEPRILPALVVEIEHELLRKNASQSDVVEDEYYSAMLADLQKVQLEFTVHLASKRVPGYQAQQVHSFFHEVLMQNLTRELLDLPPEELGDLENRLAEAQLLPTMDGRRCSARKVWKTIQEFGMAPYSEGSIASEDPGSVLMLNETAATSMLSLFPELRKVAWSSGRDGSNHLLASQQDRNNALPPVLARESQPGREFVVLDRPPQGTIQQYVSRAGTITLHRAMGETPLSFAVICDQPQGPGWTSLPILLQHTVEPLYLQLSQKLASPSLVQRRNSVQRSVFHYLEYRFSSLHRALVHPDWRGRPLFWTGARAPVSLADMQAWLEVYPSLVGTYGLPPGREDHVLVLTPRSLRALRQLLGEERVLLAELARPRLLERGQQAGLSGAARAGVQRVAVSDVDEELAAIRLEMEQARSGQLQAVEETPLDAEAVIQQLRLQPKAVDLAQEKRENQLPEFCLESLAATKKLGTRWMIAFTQVGLQGQILVHDGAPPWPLRPDHLLVKVADNEAVAHSMRWLGLTGWLYVPPNWQPDPDYPWPALRADSRVAQPEERWPAPEMPFDLGIPALHTDLLWGIRHLFKLAAQHSTRPSQEREVQTLWNRRLAQFLLWDEAWVLSTPESWFARVPLWPSLSGQHLDLRSLRALESVFWAPAGPGRANQPERTVRLLPPFQVSDLERLIGRPVLEADLEVEEKREQQLLGELKQALVVTCERARAPLEATWVEGLRFGEPTRWIGGPRKYFIEHVAQEAVTRLNPADALFVRLFRDQRGWEHQLPVLASAIYTAINRALTEVEDEHELAYLEAMLSQLP
jgi:hypothetical protein